MALADEAAPICALLRRSSSCSSTRPRQLPDEIAGIFGAGMLQLFYCVGQPPGVADEASRVLGRRSWVAFSDVASLVRLLAGWAGAEARADDVRRLPATAIVG